MFGTELDILREGRVHQYGLTRHAAPLRYAEAITLWQDNEAFRSFFIAILAQAPFSAFRWETPPVTTDTANRTFEFVILDSPRLARAADPAPFARHLSMQDAADGIVVFENLGGDATLVVPYPRGPDAAYGHLAAFTWQAPASQNHALWRRVGQAMHRRLSDRPVWLSTAGGGGVSWLHVRLDDRPKYYGFGPYRASV